MDALRLHKKEHEHTIYMDKQYKAFLLSVFLIIQSYKILHESFQIYSKWYTNQPGIL